MEGNSRTASLLRETTRYIYVRHPERELWCSNGYRWVAERHEALMFTSNIDALTFCATVDLAAVLVAFSASGARLYELEVSALRQLFAHL
jgi:hypothetical protein